MTKIISSVAETGIKRSWSTLLHLLGFQTRCPGSWLSHVLSFSSSFKALVLHSACALMTQQLTAWLFGILSSHAG